MIDKVWVISIYIVVKATTLLNFTYNVERVRRKKMKNQNVMEEEVEETRERKCDVIGVNDNSEKVLGKPKDIFKSIHALIFTEM